MVYAKVEEIRLAFAAIDEGLERLEAFLHVSFEPKEQLAEVQARTAVWQRPGSLRASALSPDRALQGRRTGSH